MEKNPRPGHHCEANEFRVAALMTDDRRRRDMINLEECQGIARRENAPVSFGKLTLRVAMDHPAATVEDHETVLQGAPAKDWRTKEHVHVESRGESAHPRESFANFRGLECREVGSVTRGGALGKKARGGATADRATEGGWGPSETAR